MNALEKGAIDFVGKPDADGVAHGLEAMLEEIRRKVKIAAKADVSYRKQFHNSTREAKFQANILLKPKQSLGKVVVVGGGEGGIEATRRIFTKLPPTFPGTVIARDMPAEFAGGEYRGRREDYAHFSLSSL